MHSQSVVFMSPVLAVYVLRDAVLKIRWERLVGASDVKLGLLFFFFVGGIQPFKSFSELIFCL